MPSDAAEPRALPRGRPEAAGAVWSPGSAAHARALAQARARRSTLVRGWIGFAIGLGFVFFGRPILGGVALVIGQALVLLALARADAWIARLDRLVGRTAEIVGRVLAWLLLAPLHLLVLTPYGLLFRRGRRDPLARGFDAGAKSYWRERGENERRGTLDRPY